MKSLNTFAAAVGAVLLLCPLAGADEIDTLITDLTKDRDPLVRVAAVRTLAEQGDDAGRAVPAMIRAVQKDADARVQLACLQTLGRLKLRPREVVAAVDAEMRKQLKRPPEGQERNYVIIQGGLEALRLYGNDAHEALPVVLFCLKDQFKVVRAMAARAAASVAKTDKEVELAVKALKAAAENDIEKEVRDAARNAARTLQEP